MPPFENENEILAGLYGLSIDDDGGSHPVPLTGVKVESTVLDFIAEVKISQSYHNDSNKAIEAIYHFPIFESAAVCQFEAEYEDGSTVKGLIKEKEAAKQEYIDAKQAGKQANLLASVRPDLLSLLVGNLPPDGFVKISITYVAALEARENAAALVFPTSIASRYIPAKSPLSDEELQALSPPSSGIKFFGLDICIDITCLSPIKNVTCPTHKQDLRSSATSDKTFLATFHDIALDRDVVVLIEEEKCHQPRACVEISADGGTITGMVTFYPQVEFNDQNRDFVFVVDRSGSMSGSKIVQARDTLLLFLRSLPATCTFNIVGFGSRFEALFDSPKAYTDETLEMASKYAETLHANFGGTEILSPLQFIFGQPTASGVHRQVFVLTDGAVSNDTAVFDLIRQHCTGEALQPCRLFSVGVGGDVSRHLISGMARAGRGTSCFVEDGSDSALRSKVLGQLKQSLQPALDSVNIKWNFAQEEPTHSPSATAPLVKTLLGYRSPSIDEDRQEVEQPKLFPSTNPPIFNKERYLSFAMFSGDRKPESVSVQCLTPDGPLELCLDISSNQVFTGSIAQKLAARTAIAEYEESLGHRRHTYAMGSISISESQALQLALTNGLVSKLTSFIAVSGETVVDSGVPLETRVIPQCSRRKFKRTAAPPSTCNYGRAARFATPPQQQQHQQRRQQEQASIASTYCSHKRLTNTAFETLFRKSIDSRDGPSSTNIGVHHKRAAEFVAPPEQQQPVDKVFQLCILQKADGSFVLDHRLVAAVGLSSGQVYEIMVLVGSPDKTVFATVLALVVLNLKHCQQRSQWELQEQKALAWLAGCGHESTLLLAQVETDLRNLECSSLGL